MYPLRIRKCTRAQMCVKISTNHKISIQFLTSWILRRRCFSIRRSSFSPPDNDYYRSNNDADYDDDEHDDDNYAR